MNVIRPNYVTIDNLDDIVLVYGEGAGGRVIAEVARRLDAALAVGSNRSSIEPWGVSLEGHAVRGSSTGLQIESAVQNASLLPIELPQGQVVAALSTWMTRPLPDQRLSTVQSLAGTDYRVAMSAAAMAYSALAAGRLEFVEQPVRNADHDDILYNECLARLTSDGGHKIVPTVYITALEQLGLTKSFDKGVVEATIGKLRDRPDARLGCNISGLSARVDSWWLQLFPLLLKDKSLAERLILEVTETARPYSLDEATNFVEVARLAGCRVALDDFGVGFSSIGFARDARFDIIKIDGSYVRHQVVGEHSKGLLNLLVKLAQAVGADVVIEGIETSEDRAAALETGASWLQGYYIGHPARPAYTGKAASAPISVVRA